MPVPVTIADLSTTVTANSPQGGDPIGGTLDDYLRALSCILRKQFSKGTDIAAAATLTIPVEGSYFVVTGTATVTALSQCFDGRVVTLSFSAGVTLTHSSSLILPGAVNIVTQAGDCGAFVNDGTNIWRCVNYTSGAAGVVTGRNRLINGNFDIWQRGTSMTVNTINQYLADRWAVAVSSGTATFSRNTHTMANAAYGTYYATLALASNGTSNILQRIENVRTLAGQTVTVSFYANISTGSAQTVTVNATQYFGTGGAPSATVTTSLSSFTIANTGFARYSVTMTVPSISGKTIGTNGDDFLAIALVLPNGTYTIDTFGWQAEPGGVATPYEFRPIGHELMLCQRYFQKSFLLNVAPANVNDKSGAIQVKINNGISDNYSFIGMVYFKTMMRTPPTIILYNPGNVAAVNPIRNFTSSTDLPAALSAFTESNFLAYVNNSLLSSGVSYELGIHYTASAEL